MCTFSIDVDQFTWVCGPEDDPEDLCLHGHVTLRVGETTLEEDGTVSATALCLLRTLSGNDFRGLEKPDMTVVLRG